MMKFKLKKLSIATMISLMSPMPLLAANGPLNVLVVGDRGNNSLTNEAVENLVTILDENKLYTVTEIAPNNVPDTDLLLYQSIFDVDFNSGIIPESNMEQYQKYMQSGKGGLFVISENSKLDDEPLYFRSESVRDLILSLGGGNIGQTDDGRDEKYANDKVQYTDLDTPNEINSIKYSDDAGMFILTGSGKYLTYDEDKTVGSALIFENGALEYAPFGKLTTAADIHIFTNSFINEGDNSKFFDNIVSNNIIDTDKDGVPDFIEEKDGSDKNDPSKYPDTDGGGVPDYIEVYILNPETDIDDPADDSDNYCAYQALLIDDDKDGVSTANEIIANTDPEDKTDYPDSDGDLVPDDVERCGTSPTDPEDPSSSLDTDQGGVPDYVEEVLENTDPNDETDDDLGSYYSKLPNIDIDTDSDGVPDIVEEIESTDPQKPSNFRDTDNGGVPDYIELTQQNPTDINDENDDDLGNYYNQLPDTDTDGDGVPDIVEEIEGTDPEKPSSFQDTDNGGVPDYVELTQETPTDIKDESDDDLGGYYSQLPGIDTDTDGDGVPDIVEEIEGTDPEKPSSFQDTDEGGVPDYVELTKETPTDIKDESDDDLGNYYSQLPDTDTDGDGVPDIVEEIEGTDPEAPSSFQDTDNGGVPDYVELTKETPTDINDESDDDLGNYYGQLPDTDTDGDGVPDIVEEIEGTNPNNPTSALDTDNGGVPDYVELTKDEPTNVNNPQDDDLGDYYSRLPSIDTDGDLVPDAVENIQGTDPNNIDSFLDTDNGGVPDYYEIYHDTDWSKDPSDDDLNSYLNSREKETQQTHRRGSGGSTGGFTIMLLGLLAILRLRKSNKHNN